MLSQSQASPQKEEKVENRDHLVLCWYNSHVAIDKGIDASQGIVS